MRRLPIFFVIDVSESMIGEPIQQVEEGMRQVVQTLKTDPYALETAYISVIVFAGKAKTLVPLTDVITYYPPNFPIGGGTSLGEALKHLMREMDNQVEKTTLEKKGDWKPIVFLFTDGAPTDEFESAVKDWEVRWKNKCSMVAVSIGEDPDTSILKRLTKDVLRFHDTNSGAYKEFFRWITASIQTQSKKVDSGSDGPFDLDSVNEKVVERVDLEKKPGGSSAPSRVDNNFVVLLGKCQTNKNPYLMKYKRLMGNTELGGVSFATSGYNLMGSFTVREDYFALSDANSGSQTVNTDELRGAPNCPNCPNPYGFGLCGCGKIFCIHGTGANQCPWCGKTSNFEFGEGSANVDRTKG